MIKAIDFDALSRKANESGGAMDDLSNLFGETFALSKWYFIARGEFPNVNPYIASNAAHADGQQMIRAFTDTDRLNRFSKENNLTSTDGSTLMLEMPTANIISYLEQFIQDGVHGVWFNSDRESDGYFIPLKQLQPIKEYLAKTGWQSISETPANNAATAAVSAADSSQNSSTQKAPLETVIISINDGLMLPSGFTKSSSYTCIFYCRVPTAWTENGDLKEIYLEKIYEKMYGVTWRSGNSDGSRYVVRKNFSNVLKFEDIKNVDWTASKNNEENHFWYYIASANGELVNVTPEEFQKDIAASPLSAPAQVPPPSNLENWGLGRTPNGEVDQRIKFFEPGTFPQETSILPFIAAVQPLIRDYQGAGDFAFIFNFIPEAMQNMDEKFMSNEHGTSLRVRRFKYLPPNRGASADAITVDSNELRHMQTGATLTLSFALLKIEGQQSSAFYYGFEGNRSEVIKLLSAVRPPLQNAGFVPEKTGQ